MDELKPDPRESRLPAWAKDLLERERRARRNAEALAVRATLATNPADQFRRYRAVAEGELTRGV